MDIYVVSKLWPEPDGGIVLGAGASFKAAAKVSDRFGVEPFSWGAWIADPGPGVRAQRWVRADTVGANRQEIVCVPLAGVPELPDFARELVDSREVAQIEKAIKILEWKPPAGQATVTYEWADGDPIADLKAHRGESMAALGYSDLNRAVRRLTNPPS